MPCPLPRPDSNRFGLVSGLMSLSILQQDSVVQVDLGESKETQQTSLQDLDAGFQASTEESGVDDAFVASEPSFAPELTADVESAEYTLEEALELTSRKIEAAEANPASGSGSPIFDFGDLAITFIIIAIIFGGLAAFFFIKSIKQSKQKQLA